MKLSKITILSFLAGVACALTSCLGDGEQRQTIPFNYTDCFNVVTDLSTAKSEVRLSPTYQIVVDLISGTADVTMTNISLPGVTGALSLKLEGLKYTFDKRGNYTISGRDLVPTGSAASYYTFSSLSIMFVDRQFNEQGARIPAYYINYVLNNTTQVNVVGTSNYYFGETTVNSVDGGAPYSTYETYYTVQLDPQSMLANIGFHSARFADKMPVSLNFTLRDMPFTVNTQGYRIIKADATTPYLNNTTPNPAYDITNLSVNGVSSKGATFEFDCNPNEMGNYHVVAPVEWLVYRAQLEQ
ncbi:MAG: hypothetical protein K2L14_03970 [Duncaniella sp.]|nr:hypothetical protein [Duncaniella sp.]